MTKQNGFNIPISLLSESLEAMLHTRQHEIDGYIAQVASAIAADVGEKIMAEVAKPLIEGIAQQFSKFFLEGRGHQVIENTVNSTIRRFMPALELLEDAEHDQEEPLILQR